MAHSQTHRSLTSPFIHSLLVSLLLLSVTSCVPALSQPTMTLPPPTATITQTPEPTATSTITPTETPTPTATPDWTATAAFRATESMETRLKLIAPSLELAGFTTDSGSLVYDNKKPISLAVESYNSYSPHWVTQQPLKDFILHVNITWDSTSGLAGCGILFRAEDDIERGARYRYDMLRLSGAPGYWMIYEKYNQIQNELIGYTPNQAINAKPESINTIILVAQGDLFQVYINGAKMREARSSKLSEGGIALLATQESGKTVCQFENIWIWELNPPAPPT